MEVTMAKIRVGSHFTSTFPITTGVRRGDALSSLTFDLVVEATINKMEIRGHKGIITTSILAYADDVAIISRNKNSLKEAVINIDIWVMDRRLKINHNKTK